MVRLRAPGAVGVVKLTGSVSGVTYVRWSWTWRCCRADGPGRSIQPSMAYVPPVSRRRGPPRSIINPHTFKLFLPRDVRWCPEPGTPSAYRVRALLRYVLAHRNHGGWLEHVNERGMGSRFKMTGRVARQDGRASRIYACSFERTYGGNPKFFFFEKNPKFIMLWF